MIERSDLFPRSKRDSLRTFLQVCEGKSMQKDQHLSPVGGTFLWAGS